MHAAGDKRAGRRHPVELVASATGRTAGNVTGVAHPGVLESLPGDDAKQVIVFSNTLKYYGMSILWYGVPRHPNNAVP